MLDPKIYLARRTAGRALGVTLAVGALILAAEALLRSRQRASQAIWRSPTPTALLKTDAKRLKDCRRIVAFGDSIVCGDLLQPGESWPDQVQSLLRSHYGNTPWAVINAGVGGDTTLHALERLERDVLPLRPHLVLLAFGLNDALYRRSQTDVWRAVRTLPRGLERLTRHLHLYRTLKVRVVDMRCELLGRPGPRVPLELYATALRRLVGGVQGAGARVALLTLTPTDERVAAKLDPGIRRLQLQAFMQYNNAVRAVAGDMDADLIDLAQRMGQVRSQWLQPDGIHLTAQGQTYVAEAVLAALEQSGVIQEIGGVSEPQRQRRR